MLLRQEGRQEQATRVRARKLTRHCLKKTHTASQQALFNKTTRGVKSPTPQRKQRGAVYNRGVVKSKGPVRARIKLTRHCGTAASTRRTHASWLFPNKRKPIEQRAVCVKSPASPRRACLLFLKLEAIQNQKQKGRASAGRIFLLLVHPTSAFRAEI